MKTPTTYRARYLYTCDWCGNTALQEHGPWAEAAVPRGWLSTMGWGLHACSKGCRNRIQKRQEAESGKSFLWLEWEDRGTPGEPPRKRTKRAKAEN